VVTPIELGGSKTGKGRNKTQEVVLHLLDRLPPARYHIYLDNLFTSVKLLELLRVRVYNTIGTCRINSGVIQELVDIKKASKGKNKLP
jgi:hypothetical protein